MSDAERPIPDLLDDLKAVLVGLEHARRTLDKDGLVDAEALWPRLERCARRLDGCNPEERDVMRPVMLALLDELEQAIAAFGEEHRQLGEKLRSTSRNLTAGAAYRRVETG